jgi:hypothetical protein
MKAKTVFFFFILFIAHSLNAFAQKGFWLEINGGVKQAMGGAYEVPSDLLNSTGWVDMKKKFSFRGSVGVDANYYFNEHTGLSFGLHYSGAGQDYEKYAWSLPGTSIVAERYVSIHYLQLPLQYRYITAPANKISFIMAAGVYAGFVLNYSIKNIYTISDGSKIAAEASGDIYKLTLQDQSGSDSVQAKFLSRPFNNADGGAILSAGFQVKLNDKLFLPVMLSYQVGLGNVKNKSCQYSYQGDSFFYWQDDFPESRNLNIDYTNSSIGLKIGLRFVP